MGLENPTRFIETEPAPHPVKERRTEHFFKLFQASRYGWLSDVEAVRCDRHALCPRDLQKSTDVSEPKMRIPIHTK